MPIVEIPNVGQVEFPDSMDQTQILTAVKRLHGEAQAKAAPQPEESWQDGALRAGKNFGRMAIKGITALPGMVIDAPQAIGSAISGQPYESSSSKIENLLANLGMPAPQEGLSRVVEDAGSAAVGAGGLAKLAQKAAGTAAPTTASRIAEMMAAKPGLQVASAATGAGAAGTTREMGGGPGAQLAAALVGGAIPATNAVLYEPTKRLVSNLAAPYTQAGRDATKASLLKELGGDKTPEIVAALENLRPKVPGMTYNTALAAEPAGSTEISALQKALDSRFNPTGAMDLAKGNAGARQAALGKIAGSAEDLEGAKALRADTAAMTYGAAKTVPLSIDPELAQLARNPFIKQALKESADLSKSQGLSWKTPEDITSLVQNAKFGLDKMLSGQASTTLGAAEKQAAVRAQKDLMDWLETRNPDYQTARINFAQQSKPINRMELGKVLAEKLAAPLDDAERAGVFAQAVRDEPRTLKTSVGGNRYDELSEVLLPKQVKSVEGVQSELARLMSAEKMAKAGETAVREKVRGAFEPMEPPGILHRGITVLRAVLERAQKGTSKKTLQELSQDMQDPAKIRALMQTMGPQDAEALGAVLKQVGISGALGMASSTTGIKE